MRNLIDALIRNRHRFRRTGILGNLVGVLWALPLSLLGLMLALPIRILHGRIDRVTGSVTALLVRGPLADKLLERHPFGPMAAMAIGHIIIARQHGLTPQTLRHELAHVLQAARWGPAFPLAYLVASAWAVLHGRQAYWHNHFEIAARKAEKHSRPTES
ncbi:MAG: hypothetical protein ABI575_10580 [Oxalobacteraceae bacterium]